MNQMKSSTSKAAEIRGITDMPATRDEALSHGSIYFFTGAPCRNGHVAPRYAKSSPVCTDCAQEAYTRRRSTTLKELKERYHADPLAFRAKEIQRHQAHPKRYWAKNAFKHARDRARTKSLPFTITRKYVESLIPDICPVFGTSFVFYGAGSSSLDSPSLDRLHPELGYIEGNVAVISMRANNIKSSASSDAVLKVAEWMRGLGL
jgi:hypothetical protein